MTKDIDWSIEDLRLMSQASNYSDWLFSLIEPHLRGDVLEIGAGTGNISKLVKAKAINSLTCIELDPNCCKILAGEQSSAKIVNGDFLEAEINGQFDCIFSFNVLEHIEDDILALKRMKSLLKPNGKVICFVPAMKLLYGSMDKNLEHCRRYSKPELAQKASAAGLKVVKLRYYNLIGTFGWFINNRILNKQSQNAKQIALFDKYILPIQSRIESVIEFPFGQSLFLIAE